MAPRGTKHPLNTGATIPAVGFGTWQAQEEAIGEALKAGYRHIDTARFYGTEAAVGKAIKKSDVPREQIFVTTKLWNNSHHPDDVEPTLDASLKELDMDYVDLYLMHWPVAVERGDNFFPRDENGKMKLADIDYVDTYKAMEKLVGKGKAKAIGISNFSEAELSRLLQETSVVPAAHQLEMHPYLQQKAFLDLHRKNHIHITHYSPFGNQNEAYGSKLGKLINDPVLEEIGKKYSKTGAQVALAWGINLGHSVIPKSKTPERIRANLEGDFELGDEDMRKIESIDKKVRFCDPSNSYGRTLFGDLDGKGTAEMDG